MNIYLIGYRCTGKTSVGKALAKALGLKFMDLDAELVKKAGASIKEIVRQGGWTEFRRMEKEIIISVSRLKGYVVATGGGAVIDSENAAFLKKSGTVIWLKAKPEIIKTRILEDKSTENFRPALTDSGLLEEIDSILKERTLYYETAMNYFIDTDRITIDGACKKILQILQKT